MNFLEKHKDEIVHICKKYRVLRLVAFGSVLTDDFSEKSDVDFLLELEGSENGMMRYMNIKFELEELLGRNVDLVMPGALSNQRLKKYIFATTREIYAA
ncbi:MAG: nucleotidyltransferase [Spirochaetae bacterium HGW-Spirochaetae-1]|jgi:hypothetical protein|nr:MAG: nucleotidyltransferase [Spirochaetae bacterium HGW-Spirochaetae-1]